MTAGRCAGCGKTDASCKKMDTHVLTCPDYITLYRAHPERALRPTDEYVRWNRDENTPEARAAAKDARLTARFAALDEKREVQAGRWAKPKDILDD